MIFEQEKEFYKFREEHKELRFFQALRAFMEVDKINVIDNDGKEHDTFYFADVKLK